MAPHYADTVARRRVGAMLGLSMDETRFENREGRDDGGMYTEWEEGKESCGKNRIESRRWDVDVR
jgi:hypothetical protein